MGVAKAVGMGMVLIGIEGVVEEGVVEGVIKDIIKKGAVESATKLISGYLVIVLIVEVI